ASEAPGYAAPMKCHRFDEPGKIKLADISEEPPHGYSKQDAKQRIDELSEELFELQDWMWGARMHSLLLILQGRDAAGKDGAVKHMSGALNPRGGGGASFRVAHQEGLEPDFLWRGHPPAPPAGPAPPLYPSPSPRA